MPGGKLVVVDLDVRDEQLVDVQVSGDFFLEPDGALATINDALLGSPSSADVGALAARITNALDVDVRMYGISPLAVATAVRRALDGEDVACPL